jgi:hypothetical protein
MGRGERTMNNSIVLVNVYERGKTVPMYHINNISKEAWVPFEPLNNSYYVGQDNYGSPLFKTYEAALKALKLITS